MTRLLPLLGAVAWAFPVNAQPSEPVDPDSLVVPAPKDAPQRNPAQDINQLLRTELSILVAIQDLEQSIARRQTDLARLEDQETILKEDLKKMNTRFDAFTSEMNRERLRIRRRMQAMVQLRRIAPYQVLFASDSLANYLRRKRALSLLINSDSDRIEAYREQLNDYRNNKSDLAHREQNLSRTRATIETLVSQLQMDREEKTSLLKAVQSRAAFHSKLAQEMKTVDQELQQLVRTLRDRKRPGLWFDRDKGKMRVPIWKGEIVGRFGLRRNRRFGTRTMHPGLDIISTIKRDGPVRVYPIFWGYVAHAGWVRGLGRTIIIDHTRGYMSLYAHLDEIKVEVGQKVDATKLIGHMGDSGSLFGSRLYFEIRKDGEAIDPQPWLKK